MQVEIVRADWEFARPFRIAYRVRTHAETVRVELRDGRFVGRGEALGVSYRGESVDTIVDQLQTIIPDLRSGLDRNALQDLLPAGGARNAVDCALWDLEAKKSGKRAWQLAGLDRLVPIVSSYTICVDTPAAMAEAAAKASRFDRLKLKLNGDEDLERVRLVRAARPDVEIIVDANQSWQLEQVGPLASAFAELGVRIIEQPLAIGEDFGLTDINSAVPLCADESCQTANDVATLKGRYPYLNIKLDKTGGLTEALRLARKALDEGYRLMVGCMGGSSLSMAPAFIIGQLCEWIDLDGPLLARCDIDSGIHYDGGRMSPPSPLLWG